MDIKSYLIIFTIIKYCLFFFSISVFINTSTIYSVFNLVIAFVSGAYLCILSGATFIGFILIVVYVGAVSVSSPFATMMLNLRSKSSMVPQTRLFFIFGFISFIFLCLDIYNINNNEIFLTFNFSRFLDYQSNIVVIGYLLYTFYCIPLLICGLILFTAMIGAIVLLLHYQIDSTKLTKTQNIGVQVEYQEFEAVNLSKFQIYSQEKNPDSAKKKLNIEKNYNFLGKKYDVKTNPYCKIYNYVVV